MHSLWFAKATTAGVLGLAVAIALSGADSVFTMVLDAWGLLGAAFAPLVIINSLNRRIAQPLAITMVVSGVVTFLLWQQLGWGDTIYSVAPGIVAGLVVYLLGQGRYSKASGETPRQ
jgi:Na+/proline symporter